MNWCKIKDFFYEIRRILLYEEFYPLKRLKFWLQRIRWGFSEEDVWSIHSYLSEWLPKAIRQLKKNSTGCPGSLYDQKRKNQECWKWSKILEKIALGFEADNKIMNHEYIEFTKDCKIKKLDKRKLKRLEKQMNDGLKLFIKHYQSLWD